MPSRNASQSLELPSCDDRPIWDLMLGWNHFPTLVAADELGLFPLLANNPLSEIEIQEHLSIGARACETMLGILASLDFVAKRQGLFHLTDLSRNFLLPESPYYWGGMLALLRDFPMNGATAREAMEQDRQPPVLSEETQTDTTLTEDWQGGDMDPGKAKAVTAAMHSHSFPAAMGVARWGEFAEVNHLLDVGGGSGCFCIALAMKHTDMSFTVMELPSVCTAAEEYIADFGFRDRIATRGVDMFREAWPTGHDAVFLSNVLHDWSPADGRRLLQRAFDALPAGGRLYIHEILLNDTKTGPTAASSFSMQMLLFAEGKQYTVAELEQLLDEIGFENMAHCHTYGYYSLVSARKP